MDEQAPRRSLVLTGPTSGLGLALAQRIMESGSHHAIFLCRNAQRRAELLARLGDRYAHYVVCDLSRLDTVREAAGQLTDVLRSGGLPPLGAVVLNAAVHPGARSDTTVDRLDATFVTNLVAPHLLLARLSACVDERGDLTIVFVGSGAQARRRWWTGLPAPATVPLTVALQPGSMPGPQAYVASKRATVDLCRAYAERAPRRFTILAYEPGIMAETNIARNLNWLSRWSFRHVLTKFGRWDGFSTAVRSATWLHDQLTDTDLAPGLRYAKIDRYRPWPSAVSPEGVSTVFDDANAAAGIDADMAAPWWWKPSPFS
ncbi:dehydrogenase/reductase [Mycolicibacterium canariasense]|uniref:Dehydrogenase/reductase n=1 Tax=Mycolicibacterium canariasense TaxID=228230 RepID=A0A100WAM0_MYCCR|nr:SDR family NAD(P)-dependent oxidoreductase [Mycolicibacterium canariasense]MCV7208646.1 SDR family NAD(P)-dependent oxidoreductase [Mycolicibacterium canariasense]ORV07269.1 dehydrogenase [Mycolicibacterium canariasense]GAS94569.1 dehydrogenase/reductase [Mycolicibacterium canariasense]